jgi:DNA-binding response OmpR family regulator
MLQLALAEEGHDVRVSDGQGVVDVADSEVVILDVRLGRRAATDLLEAQPEIATLPIILVTATAERVDTLVEATSAAAVLRKPFDLDALDAALRQVLASGATTSTSEAPGDVSVRQSRSPCGAAHGRLDRLRPGGQRAAGGS